MIYFIKKMIFCQINSTVMLSAKACGLKSVYLIGFRSSSVPDPREDRRRYLQYENEVVDGFASLVKTVVCRSLVVLVEFDVLDHIGVLKNSQKNFLGDLRRTEQINLWRDRKTKNNEL